jgi:DNA-binding NarL/FixJ family response regulator
MIKGNGKPQIRKALLNSVPPPHRKARQLLTPREQEVLRCIWAGYKSREVGRRLKVSVRTVEAHRANMMRKMRAINTAQLLRTAIQGGLLKI